MGDDPERSVVDRDLVHHTVRNLLKFVDTKTGTREERGDRGTASTAELTVLSDETLETRSIRSDSLASSVIRRRETMALLSDEHVSLAERTGTTDDGADLVSLSESIDTTSASGKMAFHIFGAFNQFFRDQISENTRTAMARILFTTVTGGPVPR